jgi:phosphoglycolate phosphatase-like HAD superfamily hydrolase
VASFLVLWDVDFTLVNAFGVGRHLYQLAFAELYGGDLPERANEANMAGRTDRAIALDVLALAGVPDPRARVIEFEAALARLAPSLADLVTATAKALPGAAAALAALAALGHTSTSTSTSSSRPDPDQPTSSPTGSSLTSPSLTSPSLTRPSAHRPDSNPTSPSRPSADRPASNPTRPSRPSADRPTAGPTGPSQAGPERRNGCRGDCAARQSLLTGNVRPLAEVKLAPLGLTEHLDLDVGAYGNEHEVRAELVHLARKRAALAYGHEFGGEATVIIGDTPLDIGAGLVTGARTVGVATGSFTMDELVAAGARVVLPDLTDTDAVLAAVFDQVAR